MNHDIQSYSLVESYPCFSRMNDWDKLILFYNIYIIYSHVQYIHQLMEFMNRHHSNTFYGQYILIFLFFFCVCNIQASYRHALIRIYRTKPESAISIYNHTRKYFLYD